MNFDIVFLENITDLYKKSLVLLWQEAFSDSEKFILDFFNLKAYAGAVVALKNGMVAGAAHLLKAENERCAYYGYAVATYMSYRGQGVCREIHSYIKQKCARENAAYILHPADNRLGNYYLRLGLEPLSFYYTAQCEGSGAAYKISPESYYTLRDINFGGLGYYGWSIEMLRLINEDCSFYGFDIDGIQCAAAARGSNVLEVCAPPQLFGSAVKAAASIAGERATVRIFCENPNGSEYGIMGYNAKPFSYFNLFID